MHPPLSAGGGGGGIEPSTKFSKKECLTGAQFLEGGCWERGGGDFSGRGRGSFYIKNKLKSSEIFTIKKVYKQKCFPL